MSYSCTFRTESGGLNHLNIYTPIRRKKPESRKSPKMKQNKTDIKERKRTPNDPLTSQEANLLLRTITDFSDYALILLGLYTGMRISEIAALEEISINDQEQKIRIWD